MPQRNQRICTSLLASILLLGCVDSSLAGPKAPVAQPPQETFLTGLAEHGEVAAQLLLAEMRLASGSDADAKEAFRWFRRAAEQGNPEAQRRLAQLLERGIGTAVDRAAALHWYRLAAEQGDLPAQCRLTLEELTKTSVP